MLTPAGLAILLATQAFTWPKLEVRPVRSGPTIGTADGDELTLFSHVRAAHRFENGQVLITDAGNARVVLFSKAGKPLWTSGRRGDGPGEYRALSAAKRCTNGPFAAFDANNGRVTLISDSGTVLGTRTLTGGQLGRLLWCTGMGNEVVISRQELISPTTTGYYRMPVLLLRIRAEGRVDTLGRRNSEWYGVMLGKSGGSFEPPLREPVFVAAGGKTAWLCGGRDRRCAVRDLEALTSDSIAVALPERPLSDAAWARAIVDSTNEKLPLRGSDPFTRSMASILKSMEKPETFPAFAEIQADTDDRLWVRTYERSGAPNVMWLVVDRHGRALARVLLPAGLKPLQIGSDFLLGLAVDEDGVEKVSTWTFRPFP